MNTRPPLQEEAGSQGWTAFFTQLFQAVGWIQSWSYKFVLDFGSVSANAQSTGLTVTMKGARQGDAVQITPYSDTAGITYKGLVTSDDTVTIYAINFTTSSKDPASMQYRVVVIQN